MSVGLNYVTLHWDWSSQDKDAVELYEVRWYPTYQKDAVRRMEAEHDNLTLTDLDRNTEYAFQVSDSYYIKTVSDFYIFLHLYYQLQVYSGTPHVGQPLCEGSPLILGLNLNIHL